jgi:mannose-1-phosphate guanylyltransferase/mannose-1-phosphate guanylyltransferase/mannose-6-phosphate isomerase
MTIVQPVILSGGSGTRLWPLSRGGKPKQLLALTGERTMLQLTIDRVADEARYAAPIVVGNARHADEIEAQLAGAGTRLAKLILEPAPRNTAPAIALAALLLPRDVAMLVMPSDHAIADAEAFGRAVEAALPALEQGWLAALGIRPDYPETGYGYIERGEEIFPGVHKAARFVEKPDSATAKAYLGAGAFSWNGGIFLFRAGDYLDALHELAPEILKACEQSVEGAETEGQRFHPGAEAFSSSPNISIDYAVMEKAAKVAVVPVDMGWSDIGSWDSLHQFLGPDQDGNVSDEGAILLDAQGCLVRSSGPVVAAVGVRDLIIIATADSVLVVPKGESQRIKEIVEEIKGRGSPLLD